MNTAQSPIGSLGVYPYTPPSHYFVGSSLRTVLAMEATFCVIDAIASVPQMR
jgi:hypothetical protein